jgi:CDP-diacylglycerol--inositol 3-phosphatidyltransferase
MLADRMGTLVLFIVISHQNPNLWGLWTFFIVLDIVSHWCQMFVSLSSGKTTHKGSENEWLNFYYGFPTLFIACSMNEFCIMAVYMLQTVQYSESKLWFGIFVICFPVFIFKQLMNVVQLAHNATKLAEMDVEIKEKKRVQ